MKIQIKKCFVCPRVTKFFVARWIVFPLAMSSLPESQPEWDAVLRRDGWTTSNDKENGRHDVEQKEDIQFRKKERRKEKKSDSEKWKHLHEE